MTDVVVPTVGDMLHPRVIPAIERQGYQPILVLLSDDSDAYSYLLRRLAQVADSLVIIEHDVETRAGFIVGLEECPEPYCFHAYKFRVPFDETKIAENWYQPFAPLGHTRFRREALDVIERMESHHFDGLDWHVGALLRAAGMKPHRHEGDAVHWHAY